MILREHFRNAFPLVTSFGKARNLLRCVFVICAVALYMEYSSSTLPKHTPSPVASSVGKVSMQYGSPNDFYRAAMDSHMRHAARHHCPMHILRNEVADGVWNKLAYMLSVLVQELAKDPEKRTKWLMWVDADSMIINPALPLEIFLPPADFPDVHLLASKDEQGFNAGVFFIEVHPWSVKVISKALAYPQFRPEVKLLMWEQTALWYVFKEEAFRHSVLFQPRHWWNSYQRKLGYEGSAGDLLVHFPGLEDARPDAMEHWLQVLEGPKAAAYELPLSQTRYPEEIERFWDTMRMARNALDYIKMHVRNLNDVHETTRVAVERLKKVMPEDTGDVETLRQAVAALRTAVELDPRTTSWDLGKSYR